MPPQYDFIVLGATGFTGKEVARALVRQKALASPVVTPSRTTISPAAAADGAAADEAAMWAPAYPAATTVPAELDTDSVLRLPDPAEASVMPPLK